MVPTPEVLALRAFENAATRVPAYRTLLQEAGLDPAGIQSPADFRRLPILGKRETFQRFEIQELCLDGHLGRPGSVLTSSGHSGIFAFGVTDAAAMSGVVAWIDDALDGLFAVRSQPTLLINCLPMGVKVHTEVCTLAETSVRPDMAVGLVDTFARHFSQFIFVGEAAFIKLVLETGKRKNVDWRSRKVHVILGEEPLAENARRYLGELLGHDLRQPANGMILSSMGVAELGLNLFSEAPPVGHLINLRKLLHEDAALRTRVFGPAAWVPPLFVYDPGRIFVEFDASARLVITTLGIETRIPLIRYAPGDQGCFLTLDPSLEPALESNGLPWALLAKLPIVAMHGRGEYAKAGPGMIFPEAVKEGIYHDSALAELTTANFRIVPGHSAARIRVQLAPGVEPSDDLQQMFHAAIAHYVKAPYSVACETYAGFGSGMTLDYERKFQYLGQ